MAGTVFNSTSFGVQLYNSLVQNPATIASGATITNIYTGVHYGDAVYGDGSAAWTVSNFGTIETVAGAYSANGVELRAGGLVDNAAASSLIAGYVNAVYIAGAAGSVVNSGTISGTGINSYGVYLTAGGTVVNQSGGLISGGVGVDFYGAAGTVDNAGTVTQSDYGAQLLNGGLVTNRSGGLITGYDAAVKIAGATGVVDNSGNIYSGSGGGIYLEAGGTVTNAAGGQILAYVDAVFVNGGPGTVSNDGTIETTLIGGGGASVQVNSGILVNGATGVILAASGEAAQIGAGSTLVNYGTIANASYTGVRVEAGGILFNGPGGAGNPLIAGYDGARVYGPAAFLTNYGTIVSTGTGFGAQGVDFLFGGVLSNEGTIAGLNTDASGINAGFAGDLIVNGADGAVNAAIAGWLNGIDQFSGTGTVLNYAGITSSNGDAVYLAAGGTVANYAGVITGYRIGVNTGNGTAAVINTGFVSGQFGMDLSGGTATVQNAGTVAAVRGGAGGLGVALRAGGYVGNSGVVDATGVLGVYIGGAAGSVNNSGTISSNAGSGFYYFGVYLRNGGSVSNQSGGLIEGSAGGAAIAGGGTITNGGTITGDSPVVITGGAGIVTNNGLIGATGQNAVYLSAGGAVANYGQINGATDVIEVLGGGLVANYGTVAASTGTAVWLANGGTIVNSGLATGADDVVFAGGAASLVVNQGTIADTGAAGDGVCLDAGGTISNSGLIGGPNAAVEVQNGVGYLSNVGTLAGGGAYLTAGGNVSNIGLIYGSVQGVAIGHFAGFVFNQGLIAGTGSNSGGIYLTAGGSVLNTATGAITGISDGIEIGDATAGGPTIGTVVNYGSITASGANGTGIWLISGGSVTNAQTGVLAGYIHGNDAVVTGAAAGSLGTVVNHGSIAGANVGVYLRTGGTLVNYTGVTAAAATGDGVVIGLYGGGSGYVNNSGSIAGGNLGVWLADGGSVTNSGTIWSSGGTGIGVYVGGAAGLAVNFQRVDGGYRGIELAAGGTVTNFGAVTASGANGAGVVVGQAAGVVVNFAAIYGAGQGLRLEAGGSLQNFGTIDGAASAAVYVAGAGDISNLSNAAITGSDGIVVRGGAGVVSNTGTIAGSTASGIYLGQGGSLLNGLSTAVTALVAGYYRGISAYGGATVTNYGTIAASNTFSPAVALTAGGTVTNAASGLIRGGGEGVVGGGAAATVANAGTILGVYTSGVLLTGGGVVTNGATGAAVIAGGRYGVELATLGGSLANGASGIVGAVVSGGIYGVFAFGAASTISNYGTIANTDAGLGAAVQLRAGGIVDNAVGAVIDGAGGGVQIRYVSALVDNAGLITAAALAVEFSVAGTVINAQPGSIAGGSGVRITGGGTVTNFGAIAGSAAATGFGVYLGLGGSLVNGSAGATAASIFGAGTGVAIYGGGGNVVNYATIASSVTYKSAVYLHAGGILTNEQSGLIQGGGDGLTVAGAAATVTNLGTISGVAETGVVLAAGGTIVNGPGGATGATIVGGAIGVELINAAAAIVNYGTIIDAGYAGIVARSGAAIANSRLVSGYQYGVLVAGAAGSVTNSSLVVATGTGGTGVDLLAGGALDNTGSITGGRNGVFFDGATTLANHGLIGGAAVDGVYAGTGIGLVTNYGTIAGGAIGVQLAGGSTLVNGGTVAGGSRSVYFSGGGNRLVIDPGAVFLGSVDAHLGAGDVIELAAGSGTLAGFGTTFIGFEQIAVDALAAWQLTGAVTLGSGVVVTDAGTLGFSGGVGNDGTIDIAAGGALAFSGSLTGTGGIDFTGANARLTIGLPAAMSNAVAGFAPTDTIDFAGIGLAAGYSYSGGVLRLTNAGGTQIAQVTLSTPVTNPRFTLTGDGGGGTLLGVSAPSGTFSGTYFNGIVLSDAALQNPATITATAYVTNTNGTRYGGDAVFGTGAAAWYLLNQGVVTTSPTLANAAGVRFLAGGTIVNTNIVDGGVNGIVIDGAAGIVINTGVVAATGTAIGAGIALHAGGAVTNAAAATVSGFNNGIVVTGGAGALDNSGTIHSSSSGGGSAVYFGQGGAVLNRASGLILAYHAGVAIRDGAGGITNYGTIASTGTAFSGVYLAAGGSVVNSGLISGNWLGINTRYVAATVTNFGTVVSNATVLNGSLHGVAVIMQQGGLAVNRPGGLIASYETGVYMGGTGGVANPGAVGTFVNYGTVSVGAANPAVAGSGVALAAGGTVVNFGLIQSLASDGIYLKAGIAGTVENFGTVAFTGSGSSGRAVDLAAGGVVTNYGLLSGAANGNPTAGYTGVIRAANQAATVFNFGTITNPNNSNGVNLLAGGLLVNGSTLAPAASISAQHAAVYIGGLGTVVNYGTIANTSSAAAAVSLVSGGTAINFGLVSSGRTGIAFTNTTGAVDNFGTVVSTAPLSGTRGSGVYLGAGGSLINRAGGLIIAERPAVSLAAFGTTGAGAAVTNFGTLAGSVGVWIGAADTGQNTIVNFGTITGTSGIAILLGGGNDEIVIESASQLNGAIGNFQQGDAIDLPFLVFGSDETVSRDAANVLRISQGGNLVYSIQLDPNQDFAAAEFRLTGDNTGGTLVLEGSDTTPPVTQDRVLAVDANSAPTPIGIAPPSDPDDPAGGLSVHVTGLPTDGTVLLADGATPVTLGEALTVDQLAGLEFAPTPNLTGQSATFTYSVSDAAGNTAFGTAFLGINQTPPPNSPALANGLGGPEGFGENVLPRGDDNSSTAIDITSVFGGGLNFFGQTYTNLFVNNNGNITFAGALSDFTPGTIGAGVNNPIIAAFWADVDTRGGPGVPTGGNATGSDLVYWDLDPVNHVFTATWDDVGYFSGHTDKLDAFQLQLIDEGGGNFDIVFRYQAINWTTGDASGGSGGLGGTPAHAGYSAGDNNPAHAYELPQSGDQSAMLGLPSDPAPPGTQGVTGQTGVYRFQVRNGVVVPPPPTITGLSQDGDGVAPSGDTTTDATPTVIGTGLGGDTITVFADGSAAGSGVVQADGSWSVTLSPLAVGQHELTATQTDGVTASPPSAGLAITIEALPPPPPPPTAPTHLFDFLFTYNDGLDYYIGTVADNGFFGYQVGQTIPAIAGHYEIFGDEGTTGRAAGTVSVGLYSHGGVGQGSPTPVDTAQGRFDGTAGLGSEFDYVLGVEGQLHPFGGTLEASFQTVALWAFVYMYADGRTFYSGTVADTSTPGTVATRTVTDSTGRVVGTYSMFRQGLTTRADGTVVVDRVTLGGSPFVPVRSGSVSGGSVSGGSPNGSAGLGSEQGSIVVNGATLGFSDQVEPEAVLNLPTVPSAPPPSPADVIGAEVNELYLEVLGRNPDPSGMATFTAQLAGGGSVAAVRLELAQSLEAQSDLNQLYHQIFGRDIDPGGAVTFTNALINGSSLASVQLMLAQSPEAQADIQLIYQQVLARPADGGGLTTYMAEIGNPGDPVSLADVRDTIAHSPEAADLLSQLVVTNLGRPTFAAELVAMQNEITNPGVSQQTLAAELAANKTAGTYTVITDTPGDNGLTAQAEIPTLFVFSDISLGHDVIGGFDPSRDTIELPTDVAAGFAAVQADMTSSGGGTLIAFDASRSILVGGVAPGSLGAGNFRFV